MKLIQGRVRDYAWGSRSAIPRLFGYGPAEDPVAELWMGAHPTAPAFVSDDPRTRVYVPGAETVAGREATAGSKTLAGSEPDAQTLDEYISADPVRIMGEDAYARHGGELPYLLKVIAPDTPLSLQVHPSREQAEQGFAREEAAGIARDSRERCYPDRNHKPEMVYALTTFDALVGFRSPRRILGVLHGLDTPLSDRLYALISARANADGVRAAFASLLTEATRPSSSEIDEVVAACARRPASESASPRADQIVCRLAQTYPGDPGVVASLLLNPVTLHAGEALFIPAGTVHAYLAGTTIEIMASSDNVLRAGLTEKHMDIPELLKVVETVAAPPIRIAPEKISPVQSTYYVPVDDFELSVIELRNSFKAELVRGYGLRIILCVRGAVDLQAGGQRVHLNTGQAAIIDASDGPVSARGAGTIVQADVP
ncbi:MAG: mannose-6-phosphate isomerase, class I [Actinomycetaceae bacterium]|nr:mannose-6-phosphate isomerase, class I [Actinomycetaceae bacterium]